jgi:hypothetical protein
MGQGESKPSGSSVELRSDVAPSSNPFANKIFGFLVSAQVNKTDLPADLVAAINRLSNVRKSKNIFKKVLFICFQ